MTIADEHRTQITEEVLLDFLKSGKVPSLKAVNDKVDEIVAGKELGLPLLDLTEARVERSERASASKYNNTVKRLQKDLETLYRASFRLSERGIGVYSRAEAETNALLRRIKALEGRISNLLLTKQDTEGYLYHVSDSFQDFSKVDQANTTAFVDLRSTRVLMTPTAQPGITSFHHIPVTEEAALQSLIFLKFRTSRRFPQRRIGDGPIKMFRDDDEVWRISTVLPTEEQVWLRVAILFERWDDVGGFTKDYQFRDVNRVVFEPHMSNDSGPLTATLQYVIGDGTEFVNVPAEDYVKEVSGRVSWDFERIRTPVIILNLLKQGSDRVTDEGYHYEFGIKFLGAFNNTYEARDDVFSPGGELVTKALSAKDDNGNKIPFSRVALNTCEVVPADTKIDYYVDLGVDGVFSGLWSPISPIERESSNVPQTVALASIAETTSGNHSLKSGARGPNTSMNFPQWRNNLVRVLDPYASAVDTTAPFTGTCAFDAIIGTYTEPKEKHRNWEIWRNVARRKDNLVIEDTSGEQVESGWRFDGTYYSCFLYVEDQNGLTVDFGDSTVWVNDIPTSGVVTFSRGAHKFRTHRKNWESLDGLNNVASMDEATNIFTGGRRQFGADGTGGGNNAQGAPTLDASDAQTQLDPLYPYNHKLLIEGLDYHPAFLEGSKVYRGATRVAASLMEHVSLQDFENNVADDDLTRWTATTIINDSSNTESTLPILKIYKDDKLRERFTVVRRFEQSSLATEVKLRAVMRTSDPSKTPVLDDYMIKLA